MTDIGPMRDVQIRMGGLRDMDAVHSLYYDETNNVRRLYLDGGKLNVRDPNCFVLGGVGHPGAPHAIDIAPLRAALRIQANAPEIKMKHVAQGDFLQTLGQKRLTLFLEWLLGENLIIHYMVIDPIYWSTIDIVDSLIDAPRNPMLLLMLDEIKDALNAAIAFDIDAAFAAFSGFGYPGIDRARMPAFVQALLAFLQDQSEFLSSDQVRLLDILLREVLHRDSLPLVEGDGSGEDLIETFAHFFLNRIALFRNAHHVFDEEATVEARLRGFEMRDGDRPVTNFRFANSRAEPAIQLSDIVVSLIGRCHSYFARASFAEVIKDRTSLDGTQRRNRDLLGQLETAADAANPAFLHHVTSLSHKQRHVFFFDQ